MTPDPERIAARIVELVAFGACGEHGITDADVRAGVLAILREELAGQDPGATESAAAGDRGREGVATTDRTTRPTREQVRQVVYEMIPDAPLDQMERDTDAILALFPAIEPLSMWAPPFERLLADFRWLAGCFFAECCEDQPRYRGSLSTEQWHEHVTPWLEERRG